MGFSDMLEDAQNWFSDSFYKVQAYFQSLDVWEWVGWGFEALGLVLVLVAFLILR